MSEKQHEGTGEAGEGTEIAPGEEGAIEGAGSGEALPPIEGGDADVDVSVQVPAEGGESAGESGEQGEEPAG